MTLWNGFGLDVDDQCILNEVDSIRIYPQPQAAFIPQDTTGCEEFLVQFYDVSNPNYSGVFNNHGGKDSIVHWEWDFGDGSVPDYNQNPVHSFNTTGTIAELFNTELIIITAAGCKDTIKHIVNVQAKPIAKFVTPPVPGTPGYGKYWFDSESTTSDPSIYATPKDYIFTWEIQDGYETIYKGTFDGYNPEPDSLLYQYQNFIINEERKVCLTVETNIDDQGTCWDSICNLIIITYWNGLYVPNALTPNGNSNQNDEDNPAIFLPKGKSLKEYHLQIFDVWGGLLWETKELDETGSPAIGWNGTSKGASVPQGTYVWKIHAIFSDGTIWQGKDGFKTGPIYLVR
jgi:gliding motility-associated-like protein